MPAPGSQREPSLTEAAFLKAALVASIRPDGRSFLDARPATIRFGDELGWVDVSLGESGTRVLVSTHAALVAPRNDRPYEGFVDVRAEVQPIAGTQFERGRTNEEEIIFERGLDRAIRRSDVVDREALCVVAGHRVWSITLTVHLLNASGSALDAAVLACVVALRHFRKPDTSVLSRSLNNLAAQRLSSSASSANTAADFAAAGAAAAAATATRKPRVIVHPPDERVPVPLALHHHPLSVSFAVFDPSLMGVSYVSGVGAGASAGAGTGKATEQADGGGDDGIIIVTDPTPLETNLCTSKLHVVANAQGEVCVLDKAGGLPLSEAVFARVLGLARLRVKQLTETMDKALARDSAARVVEVR